MSGVINANVLWKFMESSAVQYSSVMTSLMAWRNSQLGKVMLSQREKNNVDTEISHKNLRPLFSLCLLKTSFLL